MFQIKPKPSCLGLGLKAAGPSGSQASLAAPPMPFAQASGVAVALLAQAEAASPIGLSPLTLVLSLKPFPPPAGVPVGLSLPSASDLPAWPVLTPCTPFLSLGRLYQRSPRTVPVSLLRVGSTRRRAPALAVGWVRPGGHPNSSRWGRGCPRPCEGGQESFEAQVALVPGGGGGGRMKEQGLPCPPTPTPPLCRPSTSDRPISRGGTSRGRGAGMH